MKESEKALNNKNQSRTMKKSFATNKENAPKSDFVPGEEFNFSEPIGSPFLNSPSLSGPVTRYRYYKY